MSKIIFFLFLHQALSLKYTIPEGAFQDPMIFASYRSLTGMAMYSPKDAPSKSAPGNGKSYIEASFTFTRENSRDAGTAQILVIPDKDLSSVGTFVEKRNFFCCTSDILNHAEGCRKDEDLNKLIVSNELKDKGYGPENYKIVEFGANENTKTVDWKYDVVETGLHIFVVAVCDPAVGTVEFTGETIWMNPYGHLPGELYGFLPFYGWMSVVYIIAAVVWFSLNFIYWKELLQVQNYITFVLAMCLLEMATWYGDYLTLNSVGIRYRVPFVAGMMTSVTRRTVARMLVVAVSMGHGIVKPQLEWTTTKRIMLLGSVYWIFAFMFEVFIHYHQTNQVSPTLRLILTPPVAILDGIFWWWIFVSLHKTIVELQQKKQAQKLSLYRQFSWTMGLALSVAFIFACYQLFYVWQKLYLDQWQLMWVLEVGFWQILYTLVFFVIMFLWRPLKNFKDYAYMQEIETKDQIDEEFEEEFGPDTVACSEVEAKFTIDEEDDFDTKVN